ncbi:hypothetical protein [Pseudoalteromonas sp. SG43-4]|uniref:hypothetical protein n=1 Tax=Pseudoalteromonas sp. SG43-4 TaxID=2760969 RepID=UPI0015FFDF48|nr:hypothetical protein [Pseudoalteromonas sp. SG43-4]MBB1432331.1 hypothetical protein [Pseudoalteromonas sp. SG43-4]
MIKHLLKLAFTALFFSHTTSVAEVNDAEEMIRFTDKANKIEQWRRGTTKRFDTFEQFFLNAGGRAYTGAGYLFDIKNNHWLSYEEAIKVAPDLKDLIVNQEYTINITTEELLAFTNIQVPTNTLYVYLYFDRPVDAKKKTYMFAEQYSVDPAVEKLLIKNYERRKRFALTMQKHATIPWYLIEIPLIGFKPQ